VNSLSSRNRILTELRAALPESSPIPALPDRGPWQTFEDPFAQFSKLLTAVGGACTRVKSVADADQTLRQVAAWTSATVRCSLIEGIGDSTFALNDIDDPHELENVDFAVLPGQFGVAENGAIWVTDEGIRHRVLFFLPQHLSIVIRSSQIVHNMHEAYACIEPQKHAFAGFISGPSKTADIEQSLVIGAHGARSLTVLAVDEL
jgi:L-lactate dehydrogenase complex protein LldG